MLFRGAAENSNFFAKKNEITTQKINSMPKKFI